MDDHKFSIIPNSSRHLLPLFVLNFVVAICSIRGHILVHEKTIHHLMPKLCDLSNSE